jgi:DNA (cytosine-5)-methyltransferase 1
VRPDNVPNLGDIRTLDWNKVEPVDIITAGFPCQDYSE